jgi:hypothetical protein
VKVIHEKGAWLIYRVLGGNSRYLETGCLSRIIPRKGNPSNIPARIENFKKMLLISIPNLIFGNTLAF